MSDKIQPQHLDRKAILYVRQSSNFQVQHNEESKRLQYAFNDRLQILGWQEIEVIDEDLGRSASGSVKRSGFERMVAEVSLGKVGAVAAREVSRFARNNREWQQLVEVCRVVDTLLIDNEMVYCPRQSNDRLLLGLKGSLNEYELDLLRQRSLEARYQKASRGELIVAAPVGFLKTGTKRGKDQRLEKDPDARIQEAIKLVFRKCFELGSLRQVLFWLIENGLQMPSRNSSGDLIWKRPVYSTLYQMVSNPAYGGAYCYGRTQSKRIYQDGVSRQTTVRKRREQWHTLIPDHHQGYVTWQKFERLQKLLADNNLSAGIGAPRKGAALMAGLFRCRRCSRKLVVHYTGGTEKFPRYCCQRGFLDNGEPKCISFGGMPIDRAVSEMIFRVVEPVALEAAVLAHQQESETQREVTRSVERQLQQARYEASRAERQYDASDPENRLVTDELEKRWNTSLEQVRQLENQIAGRNEPMHQIDVASVEEFAELASDLDKIWNDPKCDNQIKKRIVRCLIEEVVVDIDDSAFEVVLMIHWVGGVHTELRVPRRRRGKATVTSAKAIDAVKSLARVCNDDHIAGYLNRNSLKTGRGNRFSRMRVASLRNSHDIACFSEETKQVEGWLNLTEAAKILEVSNRTLRMAIENREIRGEHPLPDGPWVLNKKDLETDQVKAVVARVNKRKGYPAVPDPKQQNFGF